jgi:hypothetical protein
MYMDIKMDLQETGWSGMGRTHLAHDRDSCKHGDESSGSTKY